MWRRGLTLVLLASVAGSLAFGDAARGGTEQVAYPAAYKSFPSFGVVDRPDRKIARVFYVNPAALDAARPGQPAPDGTVLVMEDRKVRLDAQGNPETDAEGRYLLTDEVLGVSVEEKRRGWGAEYPPERRNGEWEYAVFGPTGERRPNLNTTSCFTCHMNRAKQDFTFLFARFVADTKK